MTTSTRRRRRLLAAALAGTPLVVVPAWALATSQRTYDGNRVESGTLVAAPAPAPAAAPSSFVVPIVPIRPAPAAPEPASAPTTEPGPAPAAPVLQALPVPLPLPAPVTPVEVLPDLDWAALEQLAAFFASLAPVPADGVVEPTLPVEPTTLLQELLP